MFWHITLTIGIGFLVFIISPSWGPKNDPKSSKWAVRTIVVLLLTVAGGNALLARYLDKVKSGTDNEIAANSRYDSQLISEIENNIAILSAKINDRRYLELIVLNDGIDKKPVAVYHCRLAKSMGVKLRAVKVMDPNRKKLGISYCNSF